MKIFVESCYYLLFFKSDVVLLQKIISTHIMVCSFYYCLDGVSECGIPALSDYLHHNYRKSFRDEGFWRATCLILVIGTQAHDSCT